MDSWSKDNWSKENWSRENSKRYWDPSRRLLRTIRDYQKSKYYPFRAICVLRHRFWSAICGADIPLNSKIAGGLLIPHPNGIVVHPDSEIGANCLLFQQVTLAGKCKIGFHVDIGAGAKILGPVNIGDNVKIGANAVVTSDIESNCVVAGVPARVIKRITTRSDQQLKVAAKLSR
jgi:serine O-acetyltransferase